MKPAALSLLALVLLTLGQSAAAQSPAPTTGALLVATDDMLDPNFRESVLLILHHGEDGSLAVLINRPTNLDPAQTFAETASFAGYSGQVFLGGPIGPTQLLMLTRAPPADLAKGPPIVGDVYVGLDPETFDEAIGGSSDAHRVRFFAGHAAWAPDQLDQEVAEGSWRVIPGRADLVFAEDPLSLWARVVDAEPGLVVDAGGTTRTGVSPASADAVSVLRPAQAAR
jgi:putative transcriptional regulator